MCHSEYCQGLEQTEGTPQSGSPAVTLQVRIGKPQSRHNTATAPRRTTIVAGTLHLHRHNPASSPNSEPAANRQYTTTCYGRLRSVVNSCTPQAGGQLGLNLPASLSHDAEQSSNHPTFGRTCRTPLPSSYLVPVLPLRSYGSSPTLYCYCILGLCTSA